MSSPRALRILVACLGAAAAWNGLGAGALSAQRAARAPYALGAENVLLVILDDVGSEQMRLFDPLSTPPHARTPRMDALAASGIRFTSFYSQTLCSTTRACLQTGRYPLRTGMGTNTESWELPDSEVLLAELLELGLPPERAYRCGYFGKWHVGQSDPGHAVDNGYDRFYGTLGNTTDHFVWSKIEHDAGSPPSGPIPMSTWSPSVVRADALRWIHAQEGPFLACVAFNPPHRSWQVPPFHLLSPETQAELAGYAEGQEAGTVAERRLFYRAALEAVDTEIGNLLDGIEPLELARTVIFVVSDNGSPGEVIAPPHDPLHGKTTAYDLGIRVPLIVAGAGVPDAPPGGFVCSELVEVVDFWRTIAEIAGADEALAFQRSGFAPPYPEIDGTSFLSLIRDPTSSRAKPWAFAQFFGPAGPYASAQCLRIHLRGITDGEYKYIRWVDKTGLPLCAPPAYVHEFYHLPTDPPEADNLLLGTLDPAQQLAYDTLSGQMDLLSEF